MKERGNSLLRWLDFYLGIPAVFLTAIFRKLERFLTSTEKKTFGSCAILCPGAIGDLVLATALINGVRAKIPTAKIEVFASNANAGLAGILAAIDGFYSFSIKRPDRFIRKLRSVKPDLLIDLSQWSRVGALISNLSGAKMTIGFRTSGQCRSLGYDLKVDHKASQHELENFLDLGRSIWPNLAGAPALKGASGSGKTKRICCHMWTASGKGALLKEWPEANWAKLIKLLQKSGFEVCLTGSSQDSMRAEIFIRDFFEDGAAPISYAGKLSLQDTAEILSASCALVSVNTGIMHIGAALGVPTVGLHGATNPCRWGPVGEKTIALVPHSGDWGYLNLGFEYPEKVKSAMANIPVENVIKALRDLNVL